jgi:hypothetical protein
MSTEPEQANSALVKNNYDSLPREAKKTTDTTFDRIYKYYHIDKSRIELTGEEIRIRERWEKAWLLLCRHRTRKQVVEVLEKVFQIEKSIAYDDVKKAMMLFSDPTDDLKAAKRAIAEDAILKGADKAWKNGNLEMHLKYMKEYAEINRLSEDIGNQMEDLVRKMLPTQVIIISKSEELKAEAEKMQADLIEDIDHIEVNEKTEGSED